MSHRLPSLHKSATSEELEVLSHRSQDRNIGAVKKARKQIESDAHLLANRIALLKQEELRAWKKIEDTKKKAHEVYLQKIRNEEKQREKESLAMFHTMRSKENVLLSVEFRRNQKMERQQILSSVYQNKHKETLEIKRQRQLNEAKKRDFKNQIAQTNMGKSLQVKEEEALRALRKQEYMENKLRKFQMEKEKKLAEEEAIKRKKEMEVLHLEKLEMELIKRLQETQAIQKDAYEELETALADPPASFNMKYYQRETTQGSASKDGMSAMKKGVIQEEREFDSDSNMDRSHEEGEERNKEKNEEKEKFVTEEN